MNLPDGCSQHTITPAGTVPARCRACGATNVEQTINIDVAMGQRPTMMFTTRCGDCRSCVSESRHTDVNTG